MIKIDVASKLIDTLGGVLVFPWEESGTLKLSSEVERLKAEIDNKERELIGLRANVQLLQSMLTQTKQNQDSIPAQDKSCA